MESYTLLGDGNLTGGTWFTHDLFLHHWPCFPGARSHSIVSDDGPDCGVTPGGTAVRTSPQLLPTDQSTRGTVSKVTAVGNLTRVVANRGFPAWVVAPGRTSDLLLPTGHSDTSGLTEAGDLYSQWTRIARASVASTCTLVVLTTQ